MRFITSSVSRALPIFTLSICMSVTTTCVAVSAEEGSSSLKTRRPSDASREKLLDRRNSGRTNRKPRIELDDKTKAKIEEAKKRRGTRGGPRRKPAVQPVNGSSRADLERQVRSLREEVKRLRVELKNMGKAITATRKAIANYHSKPNRRPNTRDRRERENKPQVR